MDNATQEEALAARLASFSTRLSGIRDKAKTFRESSGIEAEWQAAEDAYHGIDAANRADKAASVKPASTDGASATVVPRRSGIRSTVLLNITRPYVDSGAARVGDMLLPVDDKPWELKPQPIPTSGSGNQSTTPDDPGAGILGSATGQVSPESSQMPTGMSPTQPPGAPQLQNLVPGRPQEPGQPVQVEAVDTTNDAARSAAEAASKWIDDALVECQWAGEMRKVIDDAARIGTGVLKGPYPAWRKTRIMKRDATGVTLIEDKRLVPESRAISPWNCYPDPACGNDIRNGSYMWERDYLSVRTLKDMIGLPGYLDSQIAKVLKIGPGGKKGNRSQDFVGEEEMFEVWYFTGSINRDDMECAGIDVTGIPEDASASCMIAIVEDEIVQAAISPCDFGLPYDFLPWQRKQNLPYGTGIATQMETSQRMLTAALRAMMDNAGLSAGVIWVANRSVLSPADGTWEMTPMKGFYTNDNGAVDDVRHAFEFFKVPSVQNELEAIVQMAMKSAEDATGLPQMLQGQLNEYSPDTVGGMRMLNNNAGAVLRRLARLSDDMVTEPHITRYYEWMLENADDDSIKGDYQVYARGATALVEADLQNQFMLQLGQYVNDPDFQISKKKWMREVLKGQRIDPSLLEMDDQEKQELANRQPPPPPQIEVAKINAQSREAIAKTNAEMVMHRIQVDTDRDTAYVQAQSNRDQIMAQAKDKELQIRYEIALLDYANREKISLDKVKADLAKQAMQIHSVERLASMEAPAKDMPKPPVEPPGKAAPGHSYQE